MKEISKAEEMILLAIFRLKDDAYGVTIRQMVIKTAKKDYTFGTLYGILEQMVRKGFLKRVEGQPTAERGGRRKTYYRLTEDAIQALQEALSQHRSIWDGIQDTLLEAG